MGHEDRGSMEQTNTDVEILNKLQVSREISRTLSGNWQYWNNIGALKFVSLFCFLSVHV